MTVTAKRPRFSELQRLAVREAGPWFPDTKRDAKEDVGAKLRRFIEMGLHA
jgi:hypothetical protein